jgi:hypothetical protein
LDPILIGSGFFILAAVVWVVCAIYAYRSAPGFGRGAWTWGILGLIFGPIALMILYVLPRREPKPGHGKHRQDPQAALYEKPHKR